MCPLPHPQLSGADMECEVKPLSNEEEEPVAREEEPEDEPHLKGKKPSDSDDDDEEPPPPYTPHDPQEEKSDDDSKKSRGASSEGCEENGAVGAIPIGQLSDLSSEAARNDQDVSSSSSLLKDHPKLIPEPSLGFQVQPVPAPPDSLPKQHEEPESDAARVMKPASNSTSDSESDASSRPATASPLSPAELSRISSPEKGRTLSEMTRITPEDEARIVETQLTSSIPGDSRTTSLDSNTTLMNSQSQQSQFELTVAESSTTVTTSSSEQSNSQSNSQPVASSPVPPAGGGSGGGGGLKLASFLKGKGKGKKHDKGSKSSGLESKSKEKVHKKGKNKDLESSHTPNSPSQSSTGKKGKEKVKDATPAERNSTPQSPQGNLKVSSYAAQGLGNSQESFVDGLSPELSDYGDHSNEVPDYLPREARILRAGYVIGLSIDLDDKNCVVVKSVSSSGAVGRDGRIRVGDRIEAINGKALASVTLNRAKGILKRASKSDEICITYSPAPGPTAAQFSPTLPTPPTTTQEKQLPRKAASMPEKVGSAPKQHNPYYPIATMASQLHDQQESAVPGPQASGGMPMQPLPPQVQGLAPHLMQQPPQWSMEGVSPYHSGNMHHLPPQLQGFYSQRPQEGNPPPPPPPYLFHHQGPSVRSAPTIIAGQPAYAGHTPPQMSWSLQQQQMAAPQGTYMQEGKRVAMEILKGQLGCDLHNHMVVATTLDVG